MTTNKILCIWCENTFLEDAVIYEETTGLEYCPHCNENGYLLDLDTEGE